MGASFVYTYGGIKTGINTTNFLPISNTLDSIKFFGGIYITDVIYRPVNKYDIVFFDYSRQAWAPAMANSMDTMPARGMSLDSEYGGAIIRILLFGNVYNPNWNLDISTPNVYLSAENIGQITFKFLDRTQFYRQPIGLVQSPNQIFFKFTGLWMCNIRDDINDSH